jgi:hypothetical protein
MVWTVRAWIDDRHFAGADNISAGSGKRHRSGIAGDHPADQRRKLDEFAQTAVEGAVEGYHSGLVRGIDAIIHRRPRRQVAGTPSPPSGSRIDGGMWSKFGAGHRIDRHAPSRPP